MNHTHDLTHPQIFQPYPLKLVVGHNVIRVNIKIRNTSFFKKEIKYIHQIHSCTSIQVLIFFSQLFFSLFGSAYWFQMFGSNHFFCLSHFRQLSEKIVSFDKSS